MERGVKYMREPLMHQIPRQSITVWRLYGVLQVLAVAILTTIIIFIAVRFEWPVYIPLIAVSMVIIDVILAIWLFPSIRWNIWRYEVRQQEIEVQSGLFVVKRTLIPMVRVQHVDTEQGPILKHYNLANISISTAATTHVIPMLHMDDADELRQKISELARVAEEDV